MAKRADSKPGKVKVSVGKEKAESDFSHLLAGTRLGTFTIKSIIGSGDIGVTYLAEKNGSDQLWLLKEYMPRSIAFRDGPIVRVADENATDFGWGLARFLTDGRALINVKHRAIARVQSVLEGNGTGYLVMEYEDLPTIAGWIEKMGRLPTQEENDQLVAPLLDAVGLLHDNGLLHLEIAPKHIQVRADGTPVLIDFGAVRVGMRQRLGLETPADCAAFVAPEVVAGDEALIGSQSDLYSIAAVLYAMAAGKAPPLARLRASGAELVSAAHAAKTKLRSDYLGSIDLALNLRPEDRPQGTAVWRTGLMRRAKIVPISPKRASMSATLSDQPSLSAAAPALLHDDGNDSLGLPAPTEREEKIWDNPGVRMFVFMAFGALGGIVSGALASIVIASIVLSSCFADSCVAPFLPYGAVAGAVIGAILAIKYARASPPDRSEKRRTPGF